MYSADATKSTTPQLNNNEIKTGAKKRGKPELRPLHSIHTHTVGVERSKIGTLRTRKTRRTIIKPYLNVVDNTAEVAAPATTAFDPVLKRMSLGKHNK